MDLTAIVLAGGKGTRVARLYPDIPKPMIPVAGQPFLYWVVEWLKSEKISDIVLSAGHLAPQIHAWAEQQSIGDVSLRCVVEVQPLGTGGAVRYGLEGCAPYILAVNGDSLQQADIPSAYSRMMRESLDGAIFATRVNDTSRYGSLVVDESGRLHGFFEKRSGQGLINTGLYLFRRELLECFPIGVPLSMETDIIPELLRQGAKIGVAVGEGEFLDIGTPESVVLAEDFIRRLFPPAGRGQHA